MIRAATNITINNGEMDNEGRVIILNTTLFNEEVFLCNFYALNTDKNRVNYFSKLEQTLLYKTSYKILIEEEISTWLGIHNIQYC